MSQPAHYRRSTLMSGMGGKRTLESPVWRQGGDRLLGRRWLKALDAVKGIKFGVALGCRGMVAVADLAAI